MYRAAWLVKNTDETLDVIVMNDVFGDRRSVHGPPNTPEQKVIGGISFHEPDWRGHRLPDASSMGIIKDFSLKHPMPMKLDKENDWCYARYNENYGATLPHAFVNYFSRFDLSP